jgi:DNA-binding CsgD family transcriptional regulator
VFFAHARSALRQRRWQARIKRERDAALAWMDGWADASFVLDANGGLVVANLVGERVLRAGNWLRLQDARVCAARGEAGDWVRTTLASMLRAPREGHADSARCVALKGRRRRGRCTPCSPGCRRRRPAPPTTVPRFGLILRDPRQARPQPDARQLHDLFGLTAAESRIANALLAGQTVETIARDASVRRDTVRAHVKRMLSKTGTRRQSDLLKLLVKTLPNLRSLSGASEAGDAAE